MRSALVILSRRLLIYSLRKCLSSYSESRAECCDIDFMMSHFILNCIGIIPSSFLDIICRGRNNLYCMGKRNKEKKFTNTYHRTNKNKWWNLPKNYRNHMQMLCKIYSWFISPQLYLSLRFDYRLSGKVSGEWITIKASVLFIKTQNYSKKNVLSYKQPVLSVSLKLLLHIHEYFFHCTFL